MKDLKIGPHGIMAIVLIALAISVRILLAALGWPRTNSDEGTIGLMALHIAYRGEHPIFYYGQNYMGALEAYLGAALFRIFGVSVFTLRLGLIFLFALFLLSTYLLASLLYTKKLALVTLALLSLGSISVLIRELTTIGGYLETLLFGSLSFLFASWLALTSPSSTGSIWPRFIGYGAWGLVIGLGFWSDFLILPFVLMPGLLLLVFCWRELIKWAGLSLLTGLMIGAFPLIIYNLHAQPGQDSLSILLRLQHNAGIAWANPTQISLLHQLQGTIQISLPTITGNPFCPITELSFLGPISPNTLSCSIVRTSWGIGFIILFIVALFLTTKPFWASWRKFWFQNNSEHFELTQERQTTIRYFAQLMLLSSAGLSLLIFVLSTAPAIWPSIYSRYLIGLLIAAPALISPLVSGASSLGLANTSAKLIVCRAILLLIGLSFLTGTVLAFADIPSTQAIDRQEYTMIHDLLHLRISHIYSDYWTCIRIIFESQEKIICGVIDDHLRPTHNRYPQYYAIVSADPHSAYAFPVGSSQGVTFGQQANLSGKHYQRLILDGYVIYK